MYTQTPEQKEQLKTWAGQRDALLLEVSNLRTEKEKLETQMNNLSGAKSLVERETNLLLGRLEELVKKERESSALISTEIHNKLLTKTKLESEVTNLEKQVSLLAPKKETLKNDLLILTKTFESMSQRVGVLDKVVDHVTRVSEGNANEIERLVSTLKASLKDLVDVNQKNVTATNQVLDKLPAMLVELQKHRLVRSKI